jgi:hypothetical protein
MNRILIFQDLVFKDIINILIMNTKNTKFLNKKKFRNTSKDKENSKFDNIQNLYIKAKKIYEEKVIFIYSGISILS